MSVISKMFTIIIPAYNEASVITNTIKSILSDGMITPSQIIIVCNACHDNTAEIVRQFLVDAENQLKQQKIEILILETPIASKTNAINLGHDKATHLKRILLDADIMISGASLVTLYNQMHLNNALVASPRAIFNYANSNFWVNQYYRVASVSNYNRFQRISNVIALSEQATQRLGNLPQIIADDEYISRQFCESEKLVVDKCYFEFTCPLDLVSLLKTQTRVRLGNIQLNKLGIRAKTSGKSALLSQDKINKSTMLSLIIFTCIKLSVYSRAQWQIWTKTVPVWERDESSRR
jgi:glycosyltransferase involved in cell wall biosynthesis